MTSTVRGSIIKRKREEKVDNQEVLDNLKFLEDDLEAVLDNVRSFIVALESPKLPAVKKGKKK